MRITHQWVERSASRPPGRAARTDLPATRRRDRGDRSRLPVEPRRRSRRRRDRRLPLRALRPCRYEVATLHELRQAHLPDGRRGPGPVHAAGPRPAESRPKVFLASPRAGRQGRLGRPGARPGASFPEDRHRPVEVTLQFDSERNRGVLRWSPNPRGRKPVAYRVYASDEKGFSVSDRPYKVTVGASEKVPCRVPRELCGRDLRHRTGGGGPPCGTRRREQGVLPSGRGGRGGQAERAFRLRRVRPAGHLQQARDTRPGKGRAIVIRSRPSARWAI